jgi:hypothetical protein
MDDKSVISVQYSRNSLPWRPVILEGVGSSIDWEFFLDFSTETGSRRIEIRAYDGSLFSKIAIINISIISPPLYFNNLIIKYPKQGSSVPTTFLATGEVIDGSEPDIFLRLDYGELVKANGGHEWTYLFIDAAVDDHVLYGISMNSEGVSNWVSITFTVVDDIGEDFIIRIIHPENNSVLSGDFIISGECTELIDIEYVEIRINSGEWNRVDGIINWTYKRTESSSRGWYTVYLRAVLHDNSTAIDASHFYYIPDEPVTSTPNSLYLVIVILLISIAVNLYLIIKRKTTETGK